MTRWARSGNTQKHQKVPGDATPWEEFSRARKQISQQDYKKEKKRISKEKKKEIKMNISNMETPSSMLDTSVRGETVENSSDNKAVHEEPLNENEFFISSMKFDKSQSKKKYSKKHKMSDTDHSKKEIICEKSVQSNSLNENEMFENRKKAVKDEILFSKMSNQDKDILTEKNAANLTSAELVKTVKHNKQMKEKHKLKYRKEADGLEIGNFSQNVDSEDKVVKEEVNQSQGNNSYIAKGNEKSYCNRSPNSSKWEKKRGTYLERLKKKREKKGILLLPPNIERKLYNIKKTLRAKGFSDTFVKNVIRKERRKEELKYRKVFSKTCFNCRQTGHILADCPLRLGSFNQETGMCFKCGSTEHTSAKCSKKVKGFPFAKCFICKEEGHISRDCPKNMHGIYPEGGKCSICGNVNHMRKDCPSLKKKKDEINISAYTIKGEASVDAEYIEEEAKVVKKHKRPKIIKF